MGLNLEDPTVQIKITESVCGFIAVCMTVVRLYIRRGRYWWDDAWSFFSLLNLFIQVAGVFMHLDHPEELSKTTRVAAYYIMAVTFYTVIWSARLSILYSIIRLDPNQGMRRRLKVVAAVFIACIFFFFAQLMWTCEPEPSWKNARSPQCELNKEVAICQVVSDAISDVLLIVLPLRLIRGIRDKSLRRRLVLIFSTSIVTTIVSLVHAYYIITNGGTKVVISALVEDCMSLTVANLPVAVTALFKLFSVHDNRRIDWDDSRSNTDGSNDVPNFKPATFHFNSKMTGIFSTITGKTGFGRYGASGLTTNGTCSTEMERTKGGRPDDFGVTTLPGLAVSEPAKFGVRTVDLVMDMREKVRELDADSKSMQSVSSPLHFTQVADVHTDRKSEKSRKSEETQRSEGGRKLHGFSSFGLGRDGRKAERDEENDLGEGVHVETETIRVAD